MDPPLSTSNLSHLIGLPRSSPLLSKWLDSLISTTSVNTSSRQSQPQIKSYPDVQYHLYFSLGIDLIFTPSQDKEEWVLDRIDLYNPSSTSNSTPPTGRRRFTPVYTPPNLPLVIRPVNPLPVETADTVTTASSNQGPNTDKLGVNQVFTVNHETTGRDFVSALGEPSRKGGGTASPGLSLGVGPWLEWSNLRIHACQASHTGSSLANSEEWEEVGIGLMVELRESLKGVTEDDMRKGLGGVWDRAAGWEWSCIKFFRVGSTV